MLACPPHCILSPVESALGLCRSDASTSTRTGQSTPSVKPSRLRGTGFSIMSGRPAVAWLVSKTFHPHSRFWRGSGRRVDCSCAPGAASSGGSPFYTVRACSDMVRGIRIPSHAQGLHVWQGASHPYQSDFGHGGVWLEEQLERSTNMEGDLHGRDAGTYE